MHCPSRILNVVVLASLAMLGAMLGTVAVPGLVGTAAAVGEVNDTINIRLSGGANDPARLALRLSQATFADDSVTTVVLATEATFADALASGVLQGEDAPLLLTTSDNVRADVNAEIQRLGASQVVLLGGSAALTADVSEELLGDGLAIRRIAGDTRVQTAVKVADDEPLADTVLVARAFGDPADESRAFADSLSAASLAADNGWPSLLTASESLSVETLEALQDAEIDRIVVMGGPAAVSDAVVADLDDLGVEVQRVAGRTRFETAIEVARLRGFDDAGDAERIILVEGQSPDAWAGGFAAAAHAAAFDAPIVLANGPTLPPESEAFLRGGPRFTVNATDIEAPVLVCVADPVACDLAREALGLPAEADVVITNDSDGISSRGQVTGTIDLDGESAEIAVFGPCVTDGLVVPGADGAFALDIHGEPGICTLEFQVTFGNGTVQQVRNPILVRPAVPLSGVVIDTETGGDAYTFVPIEADRAITIDYADTDTYRVNGEEATIGAFEAAITVGDRITFSADTADGDVHELANVDPASIDAGTVGDVDLAAGTFAIIEPVSGTALRPDIAVDGPDATFVVDGGAVDQPTFSEDLSEGDAVSLTDGTRALTNRSVRGPVSDVDIDTINGIIRLRVDGLGDVPATAEDARFRIDGGSEEQRVTIDGLAASFERLADELTMGDDMTYRRAVGIETFSLTNQPTPQVIGLVTETFDPDGSPIAPEPGDGGTLTLLTGDGRVAVRYGADAAFRVDGRLSTEEEFEAARTAGDQVSFQPRDSAADTGQSIELTSRDLAGDLGDITEGSNSYDVVVLAGVAYDDLDYTAAVFGGEDRYVSDGDSVDLAAFEDLLGLIDDGERQAEILVRRVGGNTEHRLTFLDS